MQSSYDNNGYAESIRKGLNVIRAFRGGLSAGFGSREERLARLKTELETADAVIIGAGAGLSASAGLTYSGERFDRYFYDYRERFGITDMYSGGFYPFPDEETRWAWWARHIWFNRYIDPPKPVYKDLLALVKEKNYFVITTNVDHQFQRAGFEKKRLFYTQGDYGLFQSVDPKIKKTFDNEEWVTGAMAAQGFARDENGSFTVPQDKKILMTIPTELIPRCPVSDGKVTMNLRSDDSFVEDAGWHAAAERYAAFLEETSGKHVLYLELGVGANTPAIIKYPFWALTVENPRAVYACLNRDMALCPKQIEPQCICLDGDVGSILKSFL
ncbi:MAG: hypothetical protein IJJ99_01720 [Oscillospiraceae bacterium]|nr:hypothetical protein [Oscillospiraceae bacterium]